MNITWEQQFVTPRVEQNSNAESKEVSFKVLKWVQRELKSDRTQLKVFRSPIAKSEPTAPEVPVEDVQMKDADSTADATIPIENVAPEPQPVIEHRDPATEQEVAEAAVEAIPLDHSTDPVAAAAEVAQGFAPVEAVKPEQDQVLGEAVAGNDAIVPEDYKEATNQVEAGAGGMDVATGAPESVPGQYHM